MTDDPFTPFRRWLVWLDSHDGRLYRRSRDGRETDSDFLALIPTPPGQTVFTVGDLRALVALGDKVTQRERIEEFHRRVEVAQAQLRCRDEASAVPHQGEAK